MDKKTVVINLGGEEYVVEIQPIANVPINALYCITKKGEKEPIKKGLTPLDVIQEIAALSAINGVTLEKLQKGFAELYSDYSQLRDLPPYDAFKGPEHPHVV